MTLHKAGAEQVFFVGNSVTDTINYDGLKALAVSRGLVHEWGRHVIPGAPLEWIWQHPNDGFVQAPYQYYGNALPNYKWDTLSLQPFDRLLPSDTSFAQNFINAAAVSAANGPMRVMIYGRWPRTSTGEYDQQWKKPYTGGFDGTNETEDYFAKLTEAVRAANPGRAVVMAPVGHVMYQLNQQIKAGAMPGYATIYDLYSDGIHLKPEGSYLVALTYFTTLYRQTPVGLPVPAAYGSIPPAVVSLMQETVWNTVRSVPLSGVVGGSVFIATSAIPPGYTGQSYTTTLAGALGTPPYTWSLESGTLPAGMNVNGAVLSGTPLVSGNYPFSVRVTDAASQTAMKEFVLSVQPDTTPEIKTAPVLTAGAAGAAYRLELEAQSGNGLLRWRLVGGSLPPGLRLTPAGLLEGTPSAAGSYAFTLEVSDSDTPPDVVQQEFTLTLGPPGADTVLVKKTLNAPVIDGALQEAVWDLDLTVNQAAAGNSTHLTRWSVRWDAGALYLAVRVLDPSVTAGDSITIFLDGNHDREAVFNVDDRELELTSAGVLTEKLGGRDTGITSAVQTHAGGWTAELRIPWTNLGRAMAPGSAVGIEVLDRDASGAIKTWQRTSPAAPQQSQFGNLLLSDTTVGSLTSGGALVWEPFNYSAGPFDDGAGGINWSGPWDVQNNHATYATLPSSLAVPGLAVAGGAGSGGGAYTTSGRGLLLSAPELAPWRIPGGGLGQPGTELWLGAVLQKDLANGEEVWLNAHNSGIAWLGGSGVRFGFGYYGANSNQGGKRYWTLRAGDNYVLTPLEIVIGTNAVPALLALRLNFEASGTRLALYTNPVPGGPLPTSPAATAALATTPEFRSLAFYGGNGAGNGRIDEIRLGTGPGQVAPAASSGASLAPPEVRLIQGGAFLNVSWPAGRVLQQSMLMSNWQPVTAPSLAAGGWQELALPKPALPTRNFYRLAP